jgi:hypothetical protein
MTLKAVFNRIVLFSGKNLSHINRSTCSILTPPDKNAKNTLPRPTIALLPGRRRNPIYLAPTFDHDSWQNIQNLIVAIADKNSRREHVVLRQKFGARYEIYRWANEELTVEEQQLFLKLSVHAVFFGSVQPTKIIILLLGEQGSGKPPPRLARPEDSLTYYKTTSRLAWRDRKS